MNNVRSCRRCRKLFNFYASPYCSDCIDLIDREYRIVRDYIYENPNEGIKQIAEATEVDQKVILELLRDGRLELDPSSSALQCERCGISINTGRYCESCQNRLGSELRQAQQSIGYKPSAADRVSDVSGTDRRKQDDKKDGKDSSERMHSRNS